jgi:hypothetical protein
MAIPSHPRTAGEWVTVMRHRAEQVDGHRLDARSTQAFTSLQRQVTAALVYGVKHDPRPAIQRQAEFAQQAVNLQRHVLTQHIPRAALAQLPPGERLSLQRAVDEATEADALQRQEDQQALTLHSLQRQLADLDEQVTKPVMERIQARRGSGNPLPASVQRHLEQGLNHDLSAVRIHDDAEANKLAKSVNATAFTTGTDIYFRSGKYNPNTQSGLELLAHEVTHTVQQSQGKVGKGIDPDAGLEAQARNMGKKLAAGPVLSTTSSPLNLTQSNLEPLGHRHMLQRQEDGSGKHGSKEATKQLVAAKQMWYLVAAAAEKMGMPNAARHMRHYLNNGGKPLVVNVDSMLQAVPDFRKGVRRAIEDWTIENITSINSLAPGASRAMVTPRVTNVYIGPSESKDWYYAVGGFAYWLTGTLSRKPNGQMTIVYKVHVFDRYNWDKGKFVEIVGRRVEDKTLGELHKAGLAKEYEVNGVSRGRIMDYSKPDLSPPAIPQVTAALDEIKLGLQNRSESSRMTR